MIVTRFPPSPTGDLHIGGARTALYSWLYARQHGGKFILRIEDTDVGRSTQASVQGILDGMQWLGLDYDAGPYYQTHRFDRYREVTDQLLADGHAYHCYCSKQRLGEMREQQRANGVKAKYDGRCRRNAKPVDGVSPVVRFKNPLDGDVVIRDMVKGAITINNQELDDLVIARPDGTPTYNLTVVVDDMDMGITHIIRGDDHINNTPRQINILSALGVQLPNYAHVPMILGEDGTRMSKRHAAVGVMVYRDQGYLPEALLNYLVRLGWSHGDQEIFSKDELLKYFEIEKVSRSSSTFNPEKLLWVNQEYIKALSSETLLQRAKWHFKQQNILIADNEQAVAVIALVKDRCKTLVDVVKQSRFFFEEIVVFDHAVINKHIKARTPEIVRVCSERLTSLAQWQTEEIHLVVQSVVDDLEVGFAKVAQPLRIAVTGSVISPAIDQTLALLGREETLRRLDEAVIIYGRHLANTK